MDNIYIMTKFYKMNQIVSIHTIHYRDNKRNMHITESIGERHSES